MLVGHQPVEAYTASTNSLGSSAKAYHCLNKSDLRLSHAALSMPQSSLMEGFNDMPPLIDHMLGTDAVANDTFGCAEYVYNPSFLGSVDPVVLPGSSFPGADVHVHHRDHDMQRSHAPEAIIPMPLSPSYESSVPGGFPFGASAHGEAGPGLDVPLVPFHHSFPAGTQDNVTTTTVPSPPSTSLPTATISTLLTPYNTRAFRFLCTYTGCETTFSAASDQKRHYRSVHEKIEFRCAACGHDVRRQDSLKRHIQPNIQTQSKCLLFFMEKSCAQFNGDSNMWWNIAVKLGGGNIENGGGDAKP